MLTMVPSHPNLALGPCTLKHSQGIIQVFSCTRFKIPGGQKPIPDVDLTILVIWVKIKNHENSFSMFSESVVPSACKRKK